MASNNILPEPKDGSIPTKAYILYIDHPLSHERVAFCEQSCTAIGLEYEKFKGYQHQKGPPLWNKVLPGVKRKWSYSTGAECCYAGHIEIWKKIVERNETAIVVEHDFYFRYPVTLKVPDYIICCLGYKVLDKDDYDHVKAGPPQQWRKRIQHAGSHAYAITAKTAQYLLNELQEHGLRWDIDNCMFLRRNINNQPWGQKKETPEKNTALPLAISDPVAGVCWTVDERSTISYGTGVVNLCITPSFRQNWNHRLKQKKEISKK